MYFYQFIYNLIIQILRLVAGFITEVQAFQQLATGSTSQHGSGLSGGPGSHGGHDSGKPPQVTWARFETVDLNDRSLYPESMEINGKFVKLQILKEDNPSSLKLIYKIFRAYVHL